MNEIVATHDLVDESGRTIKQNNLEKTHNIPLGTLVEIVCNDDDCEPGEHRNGLRLFITQHIRDCDGTPLYCLSHNKTAGEQRVLAAEQLQKEQRGTIDHAIAQWRVARLDGSITGGFSGESLKVIKFPN